MTNVECEILCIIEQVIEGKYIGTLKVYEEDGVWYLLLGLNQDYAPLVLAKQCDYETFKTFIEKEFKERKLEKVHFWKAVHELPSVTCNNEEKRRLW